jgi:hypothetical protein
MPTFTDALVAGERTMDTPLAEVMSDVCVSPEWHSLRLFGGGRHRGTFASGAEMHDEL